MGLLNGLGMVGAGAGEGYGKGTADVGKMTLDSLLKDAQMMKEDNLARLRQGDQNTFTANQNQAEREAQAARDKDNRQFQTDMKGIEYDEEGKKEKSRREWEAEQARLKREFEAKEAAKGRAAAKELATAKGEGKDKDNDFTNLPAVIKDRFTEYTFDENGFKVGEAIKPEFTDFNLFWRKSGIKSPYDAMAAYDEAKKTETPPLMFDITGANLGKKGLLGPVGGGQPAKTEQPQGRRVKLKSGATGIYNDATGEFYPD